MCTFVSKKKVFEFAKLVWLLYSYVCVTCERSQTTVPPVIIYNATSRLCIDECINNVARETIWERCVGSRSAAPVRLRKAFSFTCILVTH